MKKMPKTIVPVLLTSLLLASCENPMKTMKTMKDNTTSMGKTTDSVKEISSDMKDNMLVMHDQVRIKEARDTRNFEFNEVLNENNTLAKKLLHAGVFYKAMEYQLWTTNKELDSNEKRDGLILDAVKEFIRSALEVHGQIDAKKLSPVKEYKKKHNLEFAFYALAGAMHENNHYQEMLHEESDAAFELISFYDIIKKAIAKEANNLELKEYELELLSIRNVLDDLMQARFDLLIALGVKNLGDKAGMKLGDKLSAIGFKISGGKLGKIKMDSLFAKSSTAVKKDIIKKLDGALKVQTFATEAGLELSMDETLHSLLENLRLEATADQNDVLLTELMDIIEKLTATKSR